MRILLAGGGSGGHVYPLVAVYRTINKICMAQGIEAKFLFVGPDSFSHSVFKKEKVRSKTVLSGKFRRYFSLFNITDIFKVPIGFVQVFWHLFWFMPDVIFAKGGYGSVLPVFVGWLFRIPVIIHESDAAPGLANRILGRFAKVILVSFQETQTVFPKRKTSFVGNPVREELFKDIPENARELIGISSERPLVLVLGGSQGAEEINDIILLSLPDLMHKYEIVHQCGEGRLEKMQKGDLLQVRDPEERHLFHIFESLDERQLASAYRLADVIVSRAGSGAIFEIALSGKPSILMPYSGASGHQAKNAYAYADGGAAMVMESANVKPHMIVNGINSLMSDPERRKTMGSAALKFAKPDATEKAAEAVISVGSGK